MNNYIEIKIRFEEAEPWKDIFSSFLADAGCESFIDGEDETELLCYISQNQYDKETIIDILENHGLDVKLSYQISEVEQQDWNAVWESNYTPVLIADKCYIRAPFHPEMDNVEYEILIEPKMSFGTAHHETTSQMIEFLLEEDLKGKSVLDMGAGTGVLAILAYKRGAAPVTAIDNDEWAYNNNVENISRNGCEDMEVVLGDASVLKNRHFDIIIANINRNILVNDMPAYAAALNPGGVIFFSGFYESKDLEIIKQRAAEFGIRYHSHKAKNDWCAMRAEK
ncbi:MAG: 50S ribosomal protein L11 methyltransferase [Bacteroidales bacterium]|nr:50S ribosomal protein L11 methyltransferase [Bacteroidales bacterium]